MSNKPLDQDKNHRDANLSIGIESLDNDEIKLYELINSAHQLSQKSPSSPELTFILQELAELMGAHFKREHTTLLTINYPFYDDHVTQHNYLIQLVKAAVAMLGSGKGNATNLIAEIKLALINHNTETDQLITQYISGHEQEIEQALSKAGMLNQKCCSNIFIVDDDSQQAQLMLEMVKTAKLSATVFTSSIEFLQAKVNKFDIVVLDLQMPEKDGIEIMRELAANNIKPNFILVSGFDDRVLHSAKQLAESKQLNVITTLNKPFKAKLFINLIKETHQTFKIKFLQQQINKTSEEYFLTEEPKSTSNKITIKELKLAIRNHELVVHFQPQVCFKSRRIQGAETLVRWLHPSKGLIFPDQFIPLAEEHHLMNLLTEEILMLAIKEYQKLSANHIDIKVSINLSAQNINDLSMPEKLEALVQFHHINPESFVLEITESALMSEVSESLDILNRLRMKGFSLSIDDFGTGYSSLVKLYQAPFTELKIDQHFIFRMATDPDAAAIVRICIMLAKELKMQTVAEGVETEEAWNQLAKLGCNIAQGYYIAKPMPTEDLIQWVKNWKP